MSGDGLRDELAGLLEHAIYEAARDSVEPGTEGLILADAVLPVVQARIDAAVARAEAAEQAVQRVRDEIDRLALLTPINESEAEVQGHFVTALRHALEGTP